MPHTISNQPKLREKLSQFGALGYLLVLGGLALVGPYGVLAWGENKALLEKREHRIAVLEKDKAELRNRVSLLNLDHADPDLVTELMRENLNVAHPDEYIIELKQP
ncbi:septum formation initiator [Altericroceibacterium spongiae]|uniref:Septum formation initiator n=1 Tax=Altericroceibacterium spongiae TaxID=2320269 RepID=A0A420ES74_9SPHN|nr:septum formation initiator family protein [Altericroceibacterium spongiae]RKF23527.1 septum formation initiator [Altericroceibacterium spongiae]